MTKASIIALATLTVGTIPAAVTQPDFTNGNQNNSQVIVKQVQSLNELQGVLGELGISFQGNCPNWNIPNLPDNMLPDFELPELPENNIPNIPENKPEDNIPDNNLPEIEQPEDNSEGIFAQQVLQLVNEERAKVNLAPLKMNEKANLAANTRAKEIITSFSHTRPNGSSFSTALTESGVNFTGAGENIAWGQRTPQEVMNAWMNSQGHRANILNGSFTEIGIGVYQSSSGTMYWTQLFVR